MDEPQPHIGQPNAVTTTKQSKAMAKKSQQEAKEKELYFDATGKMGATVTYAKVVGINGNAGIELMAQNMAEIDKENHISGKQMMIIMDKGDKEGWPSGFQIGAGIERANLREQGYSISDD